MSMPKEPRQLMINLMYLVLTALLALNVSNEILHAFKVINDSVTSSNSSIVDKNSKVYAAFDESQAQAGQAERIKPYNDKAKQIKAASEAAIKFLEEWKEKVVTRAGGRDEQGQIEKEDDIDASTSLLVEGGGGKEIRAKLEQLRATMLGVVKPEVKATFEKTLPVKIIEAEKSDNNPQADWSSGYFHNMPVVAVVTLLSKFQNDIRNSEAAIITELYKEAGDVQRKFDEIQAIAVPKTSYALAGQKIEASIMLAAYNKSLNPTVTSSSGRVVKVENGVATWEVTAAGAGPQKVRGSVSIDMGGVIEKRDYEFEYVVGSTGASLQLDKMNVFYIGVENPVTVSAAGYSLQDVNLSIDGATVTPKELGKYGVQVTKPGRIMANIIAKKAGGGTETVGSMEVRVKFIPDPIAKVGGKPGGFLPASQLKAQIGVVAVLENFDFEARFRVTSFSYSALPKRGDLIGPYNQKGASFTDRNIREAISRAKAGDKIFIDEIKAVGPDGRTRSLNSVILTLQ